VEYLETGYCANHKLEMEQWMDAAADAAAISSATARGGAGGAPRPSPFHKDVDPTRLPLPFAGGGGSSGADWASSASASALFSSIGLSPDEADRYRAVFAAHEITLNDWDGLTYDLLKEMGVDKVGHRYTNPSPKIFHIFHISLCSFISSLHANLRVYVSLCAGSAYCAR
jgi:hypothetical protein